MLTFGIFNPIQIMTCFRNLMTLPDILVLPKDPVKLTRGRESCTESRVLTVTSPVLVSKIPLNMHIVKKRHLEVLNTFRSESFHALFREFTMVLKVPLFIPSTMCLLRAIFVS